MSSINIKFVIQVRVQLARKWHDKTWHDFMGQLEAQSVLYAMQALDNDADYFEIAHEANKFLEILKNKGV